MTTSRRTGRLLAAGLSAVLGIGLVTASVVELGRDRGPRTFAAAATSPSTSLATAPTSSATAPTPSATVRGSAAVVAPVASPAPFLPSQLQIPGLQVRATVVESLSDGGELLPPDDPSTVGWWAGSALPGSAHGSTVLVGHVDSAKTGPGALFELRTVRPNADIEVAAGANRVTYRVDSLTYYRKTTGLPAALFATGGQPRLIVISCGGPFDRAALSYRDNIVVVAHPVG